MDPIMALVYGLPACQLLFAANARPLTYSLTRPTQHFYCFDFPHSLLLLPPHVDVHLLSLPTTVLAFKPIILNSTAMEGIFSSILGYHTLSPSEARKIHHLAHTPPEYWTAKERMLSGKARMRWLHEERKRAATGGNLAILDKIWPVGPYWPNGGALAGGEARRREFRDEVGRMRYRDQEVCFPQIRPHWNFEYDRRNIYPPSSKIRVTQLPNHQPKKIPITMN
jgi:hypothetical protein